MWKHQWIEQFCSKFTVHVLDKAEILYVEAISGLRCLGQRCCQVMSSVELHGQQKTIARQFFENTASES